MQSHSLYAPTYVRFELTLVRDKIQAFSVNMFCLEEGNYKPCYGSTVKQMTG